MVKATNGCLGFFIFAQGISYGLSKSNKLDKVVAKLWKILTTNSWVKKKYKKNEKTFCRSALLLSFCVNRFRLLRFVKKLKQEPLIWVLVIFGSLYRRSREASSVKISLKNSKEKLVNCATEVARLHKVFKVLPQIDIGCLRKFNRAREIEFNFFIAWTIFMKLDTLVHHVHGYKTLPRVFQMA